MLDLKGLIREIPDFPKPGVSFKDITTLLKNGPALKESIRRLSDKCRSFEAELVVSPESRGFIIGVAVAYELGVGFVPVRKAGKLPCKVLQGEYALEYGTDRLEIHCDAIAPGQKVIVVDDLLATGGTIKASIDLVERLGGKVSAVAFLIELTYLSGRKALDGYEVISIIQY